MKNKFFAFILLAVGVFGLALYFILQYEEEQVETTKKQEQEARSVSLTPVIEEQENQTVVVDPELYDSVLRAGELAFGVHETVNGSELYFGNSLVGIFPEAISAKKIYGNTEFVLISSGEKHMITDKQAGVQYEFSLVPDIEYIKKDEKNYLVKTAVGVYRFDVSKGELAYEASFSDFVTHGQEIIAYIDAWDSEKQSNLGLSGEDVILSYTPSTKEKMILIVGEKVKKIYSQGKAIYFETEGDAKKYRLRGYE